MLNIHREIEITVDEVIDELSKKNETTRIYFIKLSFVLTFKKVPSYSEI